MPRDAWVLGMCAMDTVRTLVIGLDAAPPSLLYEELWGELEYLPQIMEHRAVLRSCHPPITIPAWAVMVTGKTPGELGLYGFRHRRPGEFGFYIANSRLVRAPTVWDLLGKRGKRSIVVGVPPTYPPKPVRGYLVSDFITPGPEKPYTWPPGLKAEIESLLGEPYIFDVVYRSEDKDRIVKELWRMTEQHFKVLRHLAWNKKWDFMMFVEIGIDRVQHAFWKYYDTRHPRYPGPNPYEHVIPEYYKLVDREIGRLLEKIPRDTEIIVVSDHGAKPMKGAFAINQWLEEQGYLKLKKRPEKPGTDLREDMIDWEHTKAWAWGGYYSRIFINLKGREPHGIVDPEDYPNLIEQLKEDLKNITGPGGKQWKTQVYTPQELYPQVNGHPPDLIVYLDDLNWRAAGTIGWPTPYLEENDRGPDDAVHDWNGIVASNTLAYRGTIEIPKTFYLKYPEV